MAKDNSNLKIKPPYSKTVFKNEDEVADLLQCIDDPLFFMKRFMKIQHPMKGALPFEPYPFQLRIIKAFHENRFSIALTARQLGKALDLKTPIPTPNGWTTMGEVKVGDYVLDEKGKPVRVNFVTDPMFGHKVYNVEFDTGEIIKADAEHLWVVGASHYRGKKKQLSTEELIKEITSAANRKGSVFINSTQPLLLDEIDLPINPYLLGVWLGDGYSAGGRICGHRDDMEQISFNLIACGETLFETKYDSRNNVAMRTVVGLVKKIKASGLINNKHIPVEYLRASYDQRLALLSGLMDTDGYCDPNGGCEFYNKNTKLITQVSELLATLGIKSRDHIKIINGERYHTLRFATTIPVFRLERKLQRQKVSTFGHPKITRHYIRSITETESVPVKCIRVENDSHLFLCGKSMIPTHNTTCAAGYLLWKAMFTADTTILVTANKLSQALEIMDRIRFAYENIPDHIRAGITEYNKGTVAFDNGSKIVARATSTDAGRGLSITLLYCDEFAFVPPNKAKDFWTSIQPVLSTGGSCIITSTPKSDEDQFAQIWRAAIDNVDQYGNFRKDHLGKNGFYAVKVPWSEHPERDEAWAAPFRESLGEARFRQEFECDFVTDDETLINPLTLSQMKGINPDFYTGNVRWYMDPIPNKTYLVSLDPSLGTGRDYAAIQVFQLPEMIQVAEWQHNNTAPRGQVSQLMKILMFIEQTMRDDPRQMGEPEIFWTVENNTIGEAILQIIEDTGEERFPGIFVSEKKRKGQTRRFRKGLNTDNKKKLSACARAKSLIESGRMLINSDQLIKELKMFVAVETTFKAKPGAHDDLVMAMLLAVRMLDTVLLWSNSVGDLKEHIDDDELYEEIEGMPVVI